MDNSENSKDSGVALVDLIIYMLLSSLLALTLYGVFTNAFNVSKIVNQKILGTGRGETLAYMLKQDLSNSNGVKIYPISDGVQVVMAKVAIGPNENWRCESLVFDTNSNSNHFSIYRNFSLTTIPYPDQNKWKTWKNVAKNVEIVYANKEFFDSSKTTSLDYKFKMDGTIFSNSIVPFAYDNLDDGLRCF